MSLNERAAIHGSPTGRSRAPTITIDTSASDPMEPELGHMITALAATAFQSQSDLKLDANNAQRELKRKTSFDSRDTRPTSPHDVSLPRGMTVVAGALGTSSRFDDSVQDMSTSNFVETLDSSVKLLWKDAIAINSTAFEAEDNGKQVFVGSQTETALLDFARDNLGMDRISTERSNAEIAQMLPFDSSRKCMAMVIKLKDSKTYRLVVKGSSEIMLRHCSTIVRNATYSIDAVPLSGEGRETLEHLIDAYAGRSLRTIGFIFRDFESDVWPPKALKPLHAMAMKSRLGLNRNGPGVKRVEDDKTQAEFTDICKQMTFLGIVGIQDPPRKGVPEAVMGCIMAGVFPRMVTGDNIITAKAIATECGIYTEGGMHETQADQSHLSPERWQALIALRAPSDPVAPGYLNGRFLEDAFVDTCAGNFITEEYLKSHGIGHSSKSTRTIVRADGSTFSTLGTACLFWKFKGELDSHWVDFDVLASEYCNHAITLGGKFLSATKTLTRFAHRIVRKLRTTFAPRVFFQGGGQLRMRGFCDGQRVSALADTGSDIPLMSPEMAIELGLEVDSSQDQLMLVELPGKRFVRTQGIVRNVEWRFGARGAVNDGHFLDFHILNGLCSDVLLDAEFLFSTNAFEEHEGSLIELDFEDFNEIDDFFCNIRLVQRTRGLLQRLKSKLSDAKSPEARIQLEAVDATMDLLNETEVVLKSSKTQQEKKAEIQAIKDRWARVCPVQHFSTTRLAERRHAGPKKSMDD